MSAGVKPQTGWRKVGPFTSPGAAGFEERDVSPFFIFANVFSSPVICRLACYAKREARTSNHRSLPYGTVSTFTMSCCHTLTQVTAPFLHKLPEVSSKV